ncbi:hypothetical protein [uncultured Martelella sp.]|uniref:hypothetical protein n=1 Tax=uncultured Martelella sp. TaxID=392331 RepID=UPI0029C94026|nr:hypothetical protein [uncultured Martelella sp.]
MDATRAIVAGAGNPMILGSIATPVLAGTAKGAEHLLLDDDVIAHTVSSGSQRAGVDPFFMLLRTHTDRAQSQF